MTTTMLPTYRVAYVTGDYRARQAEANRLGAALYIEGHANSSTNPNADYALCVVSTNASETSRRLAKRLAIQWGKALDVGGDRDSDIGYGNGIREGGAGDANLRDTDMPAVLLEPCFASNPQQCRMVETDRGLEIVAGILVDAVRDMLPAGSLIAFSIGHIGKTSRPHDRGARWAGVRFGNESEFCGAYLAVAADLLTNGLPTISGARAALLPGMAELGRAVFEDDLLRDPVQPPPESAADAAPPLLAVGAVAASAADPTGPSAPAVHVHVHIHGATAPGA